MNKLLIIGAFLLTCRLGYGQSPQFNFLPDSGSDILQNEFVAIKFTASDIGLNPVNEPLTFNYVSYNSGGFTYDMKHGMNVQGIKNMPNLSAGAEEDMENHVLINFIDVGLGFLPHSFNWNAGLGIGYTLTLDKKKQFMVRGYLNVFYENLVYYLGSYTDTTGLGFIVNNGNIGTFIKNVKYTNNLLCATPEIELLYRTPNIDFFIGAGYDLTLISSEKVSFYVTTVPLNQALYDNAGNPFNKGAWMPSNYIFKLGIVKEFGL